MKLLRNESGIALVTSLMLTLISLMMILTLLYMANQATKVSASNKRYKTALEASYGGVNLITADVVPRIFQGYTASQIKSSFNTLSLDLPSGCLSAKLKSPMSEWPAACKGTYNPKESADITFVLKSTLTGSQPQQGFKVYSKVVDKVEGNSDVSGIALEGSGVTEGSGAITPTAQPYLYRIEIQGEREQNPSEKSGITVLYAY